MRRKLLYSLILLVTALNSFCQQHNASKEYIYPKDSLVLNKLHHWQNVKFGLLMHWGTYSEWGVVESWSICPEDEGWTQRRGPYSENYYDYLKAYENLQTTFNPTNFNPDKWAAAAKDAGMKYVVFTTKHHDGFCMFDTKQTDYKVTSAKCPFSTNPKSNIAKEVFNAFRADSFLIGAYFSKPDWHSNDYWWRYFPPKDRNVNYDPAKHPDKWNAFKTYTYNQIQELMSDYGKMDILWLDGGWVRPKTTIDNNVDWQRSITYNQDIDMPKIAAMARQHQPGLLVVDRTVSGEYENYVTPEQSIPSSYLPYPWESCITMGDSWSYIPKENFKSVNKLIHILTDVVSRNGNLLLNIAPGPEGDWHPDAYDTLKAIGAWMKQNGEAIYDTKGDSAIGEQNNFVFTHKLGITYAIYRANKGETVLPSVQSIDNLKVGKVKSVTLLGSKERMIWHYEGAHLSIVVPQKVSTNPPGKEAWVFKITYE
jgi:alpha-L-fucosidase